MKAWLIVLCVALFAVSGCASDPTTIDLCEAFFAREPPLDTPWILHSDPTAPRENAEEPLPREFFDDPSGLAFVWFTNENDQLGACVVSVRDKRVAAHYVYSSDAPSADLLEVTVIGPN